MSTFLNQLEWRQATKSFDPTKKLAPADLDQVLHAIQMAPTSFGLQPFEVHVVTEQALKEKFLPHAWNQPQITQCAALLIFVARTDILPRIDEYLDGASGGNAQVRQQMNGYGDMMRGYVKSRSTDDLKHWAQKQIYLAMGFGLAACAELKIDSCPMEGFVPAQFDQILNLGPERFTTAVLPIGYRDPSAPAFPKFRFNKKGLFFNR